MTDGQITAALVGSSIAATASLATLVLTRAGNRSAEFRAAHRTLLHPVMQSLGVQIHQVVAISTIYLRRAQSGQDLAPWRRHGEDASRALLELRRSVRYPLWGMEAGLRTMARLPSWITNYASRPEEGGLLLEKAEKLREALDRAVRNSYEKGRPPTWRDRRSIDRADRGVRSAWMGPTPKSEQVQEETEIDLLEEASGSSELGSEAP